MNRFIYILARLKWLGLIGLLGSITDKAPLKLFWLFFLLGFIDIFSNLSIFFQSIQQLLSYPIILFGHSFCLPSKGNHTNTKGYILPFKEQWYVANGGVDKETSHSWGIWPQRYAYDFVVTDESGKTFSGSGKQLEDYYCYGKEILAPADGEIVSIANDHIESKVSGDGRACCAAKDIRGNYITIKHNEKEYSTIAHLMPNSITVKLGQMVKRGQVIARCGNSGNTSEPHVHFQINDGKNFFTSAGLPINFQNVLVTENEKTRLEKYIAKGQYVENSL